MTILMRIFKSLAWYQVQQFTSFPMIQFLKVLEYNQKIFKHLEIQPSTRAVYNKKR